MTSLAFLFVFQACNNNILVEYSKVLNWLIEIGRKICCCNTKEFPENEQVVIYASARGCNELVLNARSNSAETYPSTPQMPSHFWNEIYDAGPIVSCSVHPLKALVRYTKNVVH